MSLKFKCPKCKQVLAAGDSAAGKVARCKHCQAKFRVPTPKASLVAQPDKISQASSPIPPSAVNPAKTTPPLAKRASPPASDLPPAPSAPTNLDDPFGNLPDFQSFEQPIAKPVTSVDPLHQAMYADSEIPGSPVPASALSPASAPAPTQPTAMPRHRRLFRLRFTTTLSTYSRESTTQSAQRSPRSNSATRPRSRPKSPSPKSKPLFAANWPTSIEMSKSKAG